MLTTLPYPELEEAIFIYTRQSAKSRELWFFLWGSLFGLGAVAIWLLYRTMPALHEPFFYDLLVIVAAAYALLCLAAGAIGFIDYYYPLLIATDTRVVLAKHDGILSQAYYEIPLGELESAALLQGNVRKQSYGAIQIRQKGRLAPYVFSAVDHPKAVVAILNDLATQAAGHMQLRPGQIVPQGTIKGVIEGQICRSMEELRAAGALPERREAPREPQASPPAKRPENPPAIPATPEPAPPPMAPAPPPITKPAHPPPAEATPMPSPEPPPVSKPGPDEDNDLDIIIDDPTGR